MRLDYAGDSIFFKLLYHALQAFDILQKVLYTITVPTRIIKTISRRNSARRKFFMSKILVAYFSASGITKKVAEKLAKVKGADLYEIVPEKKYTAADLNWRDKNSRSTIEMNDKSFRPAISGKVENMAQYDIIYLGFPIWWYVAPTIINTFLEQYDLSGKEIIPFATSGGSGMGNTVKELAPSCPGAKLLPGKRVSANISETELKNL